MPLVVPGINSTGDKTEEWQNKLVGKTISDEPSSETVRDLLAPLFLDLNGRRLVVLQGRANQLTVLLQARPS